MTWLYIPPEALPEPQTHASSARSDTAGDKMLDYNADSADLTVERQATFGMSVYMGRGEVGIFTKILILIIGTAVSLAIVLSIVDPTFGTFVGEQIGFFLGAGSVFLIVILPFFVFGFLFWFLFKRGK